MLASDDDGGALRRAPVVVDHVLLAVTDLEAGAAQLRAEHGLTAVAGGRHPGAGTANMIVPLGRTYLELIAVVDQEEARSLPRSRRVAEAAASGRRFAGWAARTEDLDGLAASLRERGLRLPATRPGSRLLPDGTLLRWRAQELEEDASESVLPFLIEWSVGPGQHPAETPVEHPSGAGDVRLLRLGDPDPEAARRLLRTTLGAGVAFTVERADRPGVIAVELDSPRGPLLVR